MTAAMPSPIPSITSPAPARTPDARSPVASAPRDALEASAPAPTSSAAPATRRSVTGPKLVLHLEGLAILTAASTAYFALGHGWLLFVSLFLVPDLSMLGYLRGPRVGAVCYDAAHNYLAPLALLGVGWLVAAPTAVAVALIWIAHVGFDRALGYGLKYGTAFRDTHLGRV